MSVFPCPRLRAVFVCLSVCLALLSSGCGYALAGRGTFLPSYIHTIAIPQLENRTTVFQVEQVLTEKIRSEFIGRGKYSVVAGETGGDAVLNGEITGISVQPVGFTNQQLASRYLFTLTMRLRFTDARTSEVLWSDDALTFRGEYELQATGGDASAVGASFLDQQSSAFDRIGNDVARSVVTAISEAF
jgi:hypothetical protein